ncbi:MAG TPA: Gx transporter family protein [Exilispira sp.]|nr:Gx transporter family protein [Exilispira sp.]
MTQLPIEKKTLFFPDRRYILFFSTLAAVFSFIESILPKPFLFIKIGLGYIPILLIIDKVDYLPFISIVLLKSIITGIFAGTLFSFTGLLSIVGSLGCIVAYSLIYFFIKKLSRVSISILLAIFTNIFQLIFYSYFIIKDYNLLKILPLVNLISIITGFITSLISIQIEEKYIELDFENLKNKKIKIKKLK